MSSYQLAKGKRLLLSLASDPKFSQSQLQQNVNWVLAMVDVSHKSIQL